MSTVHDEAIIVLSPHLDDAVFSAAGRLMTGDVLVITVFAGVPSRDQPAGNWDRLTAATCAHSRALERLAENDAAMKKLGCRAMQLDEADEQHRDQAVDRGRLCRRLRPLLAAATQLWLPAGLGCHKDHLALRDCGLSVVGRIRGEQSSSHPRPAVFLYADVPYAIRYGWANWIDPSSRRDFLDVGYWLESEMAKSGLSSLPISPMVRELDAAQRERKLAAVMEYRTQLAALRMDRLVTDRSVSLLNYELYWRLDTGMRDGKCLPPERRRLGWTSRGSQRWS